MHEKEIEKLQAEKEKVERQLAQEQHKIQRLENQPFQDFDANEMTITLFFAFAVQRAVKEVLIEIAVVG